MRPVAVLLLWVIAAACEASSYMHSSGEWYYRGSLGASQATETWDTNGDLQDIGCTSEHSGFSNQLEYAPSYYYNLFGRLGVGRSHCGPNSKTGLGDLDLGIRGRLNPYKNYHSWELDATIPLHGNQAGQARLGCGAFGAGASVDVAERLSEQVTLGYGAGVKFWQAPLAHQAKTQVQLVGPLGLRGATAWTWLLGLTGEAPLNERPVDPTAAIDDCGTQAKAIRSAAEVRYRYARGVTFACSAGTTVWGEDVSRATGLSCSFSKLWED